MTDFTPETPVLTPSRDHAAELAKAEAGVAEMAAKRNNRWYPKYHIASNGGWINDPNGLCFYKGRWHVFQIHAGLMPSATKALERQAAFMKQQWGV